MEEIINIELFMLGRSSGYLVKKKKKKKVSFCCLIINLTSYSFPKS